MKYLKEGILVVGLCIIGIIFIFYANILHTTIGYLENKIDYLVSQCEYHADAFICDYLIRSYKYQLDVIENVQLTFYTVGGVLIAIGIIYGILSIHEKRG